MNRYISMDLGDINNYVYVVYVLYPYRFDPKKSIQFLGVFRDREEAIIRYDLFIRNDIKCETDITIKSLRENPDDVWANEFYCNKMEKFIYVMIEKQTVVK